MRIAPGLLGSTLSCVLMSATACSQLQAKAAGALSANATGGGSSGPSAATPRASAPASQGGAEGPSPVEKENAQNMMEMALDSYCIRTKEENDPNPRDGSGLSALTLQGYRSHVQQAQQQYQRARGEYLQTNPAIATSTKTFKAQGQTYVTTDAIKTCDLWHAEALKQLDALVARATAREAEQDKKRAQAQKEADGAEEKWAKQLKGDRKALKDDRGWPNESEGGDQWARIVKARWWMYGTNHSSERNDYLCKETIYFSGDKIAKRSRSGFCR
jgi:hypothetical protein